MRFEHGTASLRHVCKHKEVFPACRIVIQKWYDPEYVFMKHMCIKLNYIPVLTVLLITDSLGIHKICI